MDDLVIPEGTTIASLAKVLSGELNGIDSNISGAPLTTDSRKVVPGSIFLAYQGVSVDGHSFLREVVQKGAALCIVEDASGLEADVPRIVVPNGRRALSRLAAFICGYPTRRLKCFGITGTNGKTTSLWLLSEALTMLGERVLRIGTLGIDFEGESVGSGETTTPTAEVIQSSAREALEKGATACVMEVSSHALDQARADDVSFDGALFTNLTPDHLDYHPTERHYFESKRLLFSLAISGQKEVPLISGLFDDYGRELNSWAKEQSSHARGFGRELDADYQLKKLTLEPAGLKATIVSMGREVELESPLIGEFNAFNLLGVFSLLCELGYDVETVCSVLSKLTPPSGRLERFSYNGASVFVDYAHAPDALRTVLGTLREVTERNLWVLFGCGGDRDPRRRVGMGKAAMELADKIIVTSDNPRSESPEKIVEDILSSGVSAELIELDRKEAIRKALSLVQPGDVLLIAGKGHEEYQVIKGETKFFSDQKEVRDVIAGI